MSDFTPGPWVRGGWTIFDRDRAAQRRGEPYWTLVEGDEDICGGPLGRKSNKPDRIIVGVGCECDGTAFDNEADERLVLAAPEMYEALVLLTECNPDFGLERFAAALDVARAALAKARGPG